MTVLLASRGQENELLHILKDIITDKNENGMFRRISFEIFIEKCAIKQEILELAELLLDDHDLSSNAAIYLIDNRYHLDFVTAKLLVLIKSGEEDKKWILQRAIFKTYN